ncbi:helix-turn-helix domain-containing protein [Cohnella silvisoli]|uniref:AraC family transcriptional regulator n=1 Tax=Cohnella silvisoli TaxID=2873699 RepID=A0ABV1KMQ9_9BACL|nr:AraC family transcriptional regulator [Cohnella silvisoli]MCD9020439.1 AraC family transcriptional regulator [Cohnella silvisoli]
MMPMFIREYEKITSLRSKQIMGGGIHPYYELLYISEGAFKIQWIDSAFTASGPALFIVTPSSPHQIEQLSPVLDCWFVEFRLQHAEFVPSLDVLRIWNTSQSLMDWNADSLSDLRDTLQSLDKAICANLPRTSGDIFYRIMACDIQKLMLQIDHYATTTLTATKKAVLSPPSEKWSAHSHIYGLIRFMEDHYIQEITLDELAKRSGYTPSYIIRLFKEMTDSTPFQYLNELRMFAATSYLQSGEKSIQNIAESIGFPNIHYFSRMFKKKFGVSPTEWKKTHV